VFVEIGFTVFDCAGVQPRLQQELVRTARLLKLQRKQEKQQRKNNNASVGSK
jgi:hypothetical protein